jgi:HSP20 family molecular chaperone IbpA
MVDIYDDGDFMRIVAEASGFNEKNIFVNRIKISKVYRNRSYKNIKRRIQMCRGRRFVRVDMYGLLSRSYHE